jgi:gluconate 2-dehydrogenase gamma chain
MCAAAVPGLYRRSAPHPAPLVCENQGAVDHLHDRRLFLRAVAAAGMAWAVADLEQVEAALDWSAQHAATSAHAAKSASLSVLTRAQADVVDALSARILPSVDGRPGAHDAGVVWFVDRALATFNASQKAFYVDGIADLNRRAAAVSPTAAGFAALTPVQQDAILREIEQTPFFQAARFDTIVGTFGLPTWGGNRDYAGWRLLGVEHKAAFQAPFGYYDAEINGKGGR